MRNSELLFAAVSRIANALSAMPLQLYKNSAPVSNDLNDLLGFAPNPNMTSAQFLKTMEACRDTSGNAYAMKVIGADGELERIDILDPARVTPLMNDKSGELWYKIQPESGNPYYLHSFYILHIPFISTNGYSGVNPVSVLCDTLGYNEKIQKFSAEQLEKGINAQFALEAPSNLSPQQRKETIKSFKETYFETGGDILLLESGVTAKTLNLSPVDAKVFDVEKISRSRVAMVYNLPPHLLGDYSDTSFASQEQQALEFLMLTMLPIVVAYEQEFNRKLLTREERKQGYQWKFHMESILRADAAVRADVFQKAVRGGWMMPNEVRKEYGLPTKGEGNKLLVARDLTTLEYLVRNPERKEISNIKEGSANEPNK
jgi:HK97 family phage portal protein